MLQLESIALKWSPVHPFMCKTFSRTISKDCRQWGPNRTINIFSDGAKIKENLNSRHNRLHLRRLFMKSYSDARDYVYIQ